MGFGFAADEVLTWRRRAARDAWVTQPDDVGLEPLVPPERAAWRLDQERLDKAILIKCIDPVGSVGRGESRGSAQPTAPTWGIASCSRAERTSRLPSSAPERAANTRREVSSDEEYVGEVHPKRRRA
eukprot:5649881-Pleurochrysis_carterae.AAC.1